MLSVVYCGPEPEFNLEQKLTSVFSPLQVLKDVNLTHFKVDLDAPEEDPSLLQNDEGEEVISVSERRGPDDVEIVSAIDPNVRNMEADGENSGKYQFDPSLPYNYEDNNGKCSFAKQNFHDRETKDSGVKKIF